MATVFDPFTPALWGLTFLALAFAGVILTYDAEKPESTRLFCESLPGAIVKGLNGFHASEVIDTERSSLHAWLTSFFLGFTVLVLTTS